MLLEDCGQIIMKRFDFKHENYHLGHMMVDVLSQQPDAICQIDVATGESETNASMLSRSIRMARCLRRLGLQPGAVLALGGRNHLDLHVPYYAALMNGYPIIGVDPLFKVEEIKTVFKISCPKVAYCQDEHYHDYVAAIKELGLDTRVITFDDGDHSMAKFLEEYHDDEPTDSFEPAIFDREKIYAVLLSTSGTTGGIKLAATVHNAWLAKMFELTNLYTADNTMEIVDYKPAMNVSPIQWITGFLNAVFMPMMRYTKVQTSAAPLTTDHIIDIINEYRPEAAGITGPTLWASILQSEKPCDITCFENIVLSGGKVYNDTLLELKKRLSPDAVVKEIYGQTENSGPALLPNPTGPNGNCGREFPAGNRLKLVDPETGKEITEPNVPGELWTKGKATFTEYYNNPEETARAFTPDGWFKTGDILYRDEEGNYYFVERLKMLIKYRSYHVVPLELEAVIRKLSGVAEVSVTSVPHSEDGEHPVACVVRAPHAPLTAARVKQHVAARLSDAKQLRGGVVFLQQLPLTSTGKVARGRLREMVLTAHRE